MMRLTNTLGLPRPLYDAIVAHKYDREGSDLT